MGYDRVDLTVRARLSDNGGDVTARHRAAWDEFVDKVRELAHQEPYREVIILDWIDADPVE